MEGSYLVSIVFLFVLNVIFVFLGICLNSLVILIFWRSVLLRKKPCYFMIMVLSCFDLLSTVTNHPILALTAILWLTGRFDMLPWVFQYLHIANIFLGFSLLVLLVMNFERYLATHYPIFHRTSVTKTRLFTLLGILMTLEVLLALGSVNDFVMSNQVFVIISFAILFPPMLFFNYKLFRISRKTRQESSTLHAEKKQVISLKNISSCLLAVACFVVLSIPAMVYVGIRSNSEKTLTINNGKLAAHWSKTILSMNSTFNCLIFFWKNKILRIEGIKMLKQNKYADKHMLHG